MKTLAAIRNSDFGLENSSAKIIASRNCPEIKLAGLTVGPLEEGNEYEVYYWIASELEKSGVARFREEEQLDMSKLNKIQWTERIQAPGQISKLPEDFYPRLRRYRTKLEEGIARDPEKMREYERVKHLTQDIVNSRLRKIISIASAPAQTENSLRNLSSEEKFLYKKLYKNISNWKTQILEYEGEQE